MSMECWAAQFLGDFLLDLPIAPQIWRALWGRIEKKRSINSCLIFHCPKGETVSKVSECSGARKQGKQGGASKRVSSASERTSGLALTSGFLIDLAHCVLVIFSFIHQLHCRFEDRRSWAAHYGPKRRKKSTAKMATLSFTLPRAREWVRKRTSERSSAQ